MLLPAGTTTVDGTVAAGLLLDAEIGKSWEGSSDSVISFAVVVLPPTTEVGFNTRDCIAIRLTVSVAVAV